MYVDLGLPSGLKWAKCDLDLTQPNKFAQSPFQYEKSFFSWGNIDGHNPFSENKFDYDWGGINAMAPYFDGQPYGDTPGASISADLTSSQDAARVTLGSPWRMPTTDEFKELFDNCTCVAADGVTEITGTNKCITLNGVIGIYLKSNINGEHIFFACSGDGRGTSWENRGSYGLYWSGSFGTSAIAYNFNFSSSAVHSKDRSDRFLGYVVRPVFGAGLRSTRRSLSLPVDDERLEREVDDNRFVTKYESNVQE